MKLATGYLPRLEIMLGIVSGVAYMHDSQYLHRDIKVSPVAMLVLSYYL